MANIKNIIKVMNFYSLVRVDKAKRDAQKFFDVDEELDRILYQLVNNNNLKLDKKILLANPNGMVLNIYIGNDMGFCADFNTSIRKAISSDEDANKIIIGKKVFVEKPNEKILLQLQKKRYLKDYRQIDDIIYKNIRDKKIKEINVIYNRYINVNEIVLDRKRVFPIEIDDKKYEDIKLTNDFVIETDVDSLFYNIVSILVCYQVQILERSSWASENVMRERVTRESSKKIEEIEEARQLERRKKKKEIDFKKQIELQRNITKIEEEE